MGFLHPYNAGRIILEHLILSFSIYFLLFFADPVEIIFLKYISYRRSPSLPFEYY
jgi:hypothetical protein